MHNTKIHKVLDKESFSLAEYSFIYKSPIFLDFSIMLQCDSESSKWIESSVANIAQNINAPVEDLKFLVKTFFDKLDTVCPADAKFGVYSLYLAIEYSAKVEHPDRYELNSATAQIEQSNRRN